MQHEILKTNLRDTRWGQASKRDLSPGDIRLRLDSFALTANNVTYAAFGGPPMNYWNFFPASSDKFGRVPVWGFATVSESASTDVGEGRKVYGYFPISEDLIVQPTRISERGFADGAMHRQGLAPIYNTYVYTDTDPTYKEDFEAQQALFRPLYMTGWMICDSLMEGSPKPDRVYISSASSKTALATAHSVKRRGVRTIGLTSARNVEFVLQTELYDEVINYETASDVSASGNVAYVDFLGRPDFTMTMHQTLGTNLKRSMVIGVTDWEGDRRPIPDLPGPEPEFFFVPDYAVKRAKEFEAGELDKRVGADLISFYPASRAFVTPVQVKGADAIQQAWLDTVDGKISPRDGLICRF